MIGNNTGGWDKAPIKYRQAMTSSTGRFVGFLSAESKQELINKIKYFKEQSYLKTGKIVIA